MAPPDREALTATPVDTPVDAIVVNFNAGDALVRCLRSLLGQSVPVQITVIDNASTDGSAGRARALFADRENVRIVDNEGNPGFASGVNMAVRIASGALAGDARGRPLSGYFLIVNPDCELRENALALLVGALDGDPGAVVAGPAVVGRSGELLRGTLRRFPDPWKSLMTFSGLSRLGRNHRALQGVEVDAGAVADASPAEAVSGACMLVRKADFLAAGGMDDAYRLHCEDLDLMYRLSRHGGHCLYVPAARVFHQQGVSSASRPLWAHWQKHLGMLRFFRKFQAAGHAWPVRWLVALGIWLKFAATLPWILLRR